MKKFFILFAAILLGVTTALADKSADAPTTAATAPTVVASNVLSVYSDTYTTGVTSLNLYSSWNQTTSLEEITLDNSNKYLQMTNFNYQGHEFDKVDLTDYGYLHVDVYPTTSTTIGIVPIWYDTTNSKTFNEIRYTISNMTLNAWNSISIPLSAFASDDRNGTNICYQLKWDSSANSGSDTFFVDNIYFFKVLSLTATAQNVTSTSAEIAYTVSGDNAAQATVYYKASGDASSSYNSVSGSPISLSNLSASTSYTYELYATYGNETTSTVTVTFTTANSEGNFVYSDYVKAAFKNSYLTGEDASAARTHYYSLPFSVTLKADGTARYEIDLSDCINIDGLSPQIYWNDYRSLTKGDNNVYYYDFGTQTYGEAVSISHYLAYANGGIVDINFGSSYGTWGLTKAKPTIGDATSLSLAVPIGRRFVKMGDSFYLNLYATDANGYYVSTDAVQLSATENKATLSKTNITVNCLLEPVTVTATLNGLTATATIDAIAPSTAENTTGTIYLDGTEYTEKAITDGSYSSYYDFGTASKNHSICFDLGEAKTISSVYLGWEGAYPSKYTVTFTNTNPITANSGSAAPKRKETTETTDITRDQIDPVYSTVDGVNVAEAVYYPNTEDTYRYVNVVTSEAATQWGIKLSEAKVYTGIALTGIEDVNVEDDATAPVEYYNLNGIRVLNPEHGLYIRRQGNKAQKVVL